MTREPTASELCAEMATAMTAHIASGRRVKLHEGGVCTTDIRTAEADGRDLIVNGNERRRVHADSSLNSFGVMWFPREVA